MVLTSDECPYYHCSLATDKSNFAQETGQNGSY